MFLIIKFLATEALSKNTLADRRQSAGSCPALVRQPSQMWIALHFKVKFDQLFVQRSSTITIDCKLADLKLESSEAYLPRLEKNLSLGFEIFDIFCNNAALNIRRYLKRFQKSWKSVKSFLPKNAIQKHNQRAF